MTFVFKPVASATLPASTTSARIALPAQTENVRLVNDGAGKVFVAFGDSSVVATVSDMVLIQNQPENFRVPRGASHVAAVTASGAVVLNVTSGEGN